MPPSRLVIRDFAQISEASIVFRDLTVLVGAQGTGKSLVLQWLKAAIDGKYIVETLRDAGEVVSRKTVIDLLFGVGMKSAWRDTTKVRFDGKDMSRATIEKRGDGVEKLFFIPAHRSMLISDGWATPFQKLTAEPPRRGASVQPEPVRALQRARGCTPVPAQPAAQEGLPRAD